MSHNNWLARLLKINHRKLMRIYPPFLLMGVKARISKDGRSVSLTVPSRWFYQNNNGVTFGGILVMLSDPFPSLLFEELIPDTKAWSTNHSIEYIRPIIGKVEASFNITDKHLEFFKSELKSKRAVSKTFEYYFTNKHGNKVAKITTTTYLRANRRKSIKK